MEYSFVATLRNQLLSLIPELKTDKHSLLVAVSGGADSVSLICALSSLKQDLPISLFVTTVNHNLREASETDGDAIFVKELANRLSLAFDCIELSSTEIHSFAKTNSCGIEAAARHFRYQALEASRVKNSCSYILTAHNLDDYYETVLMRLFQGGNPESLNGIKSRNGKVLRPLLCFSRNEILAYLSEIAQSYRTDSTNFDTTFLRNSIRHNLVPALDKTFPNWRKSLNKTLSKIADDCEALDQIAFAGQKSFADQNAFAQQMQKESFKRCSESEVVLDARLFVFASTAIKRRLLQAAFTHLKLFRISNSFMVQCFSLKPGKRLETSEVTIKHIKKELRIAKKEQP